MTSTASSGGRPASGRIDSTDHWLVRCSGLVRIYKTDAVEVVALQGLDLTVEPGEMVAVVGASGSGKSTLLSILGGLDAPTAGQVTVAGHDLMAFSPNDRARYRRDTVGFVGQQTARNLVPFLSALDNVALPMALAGVGRRTRRRRARELLDLVGLGDRLRHRPNQLSGGQQQRTAIAVALANRPTLLLADEPTGELDVDTAAGVMEVFAAANRERGTTAVVVTHDSTVSQRLDRTVTIRDGRISSERLIDEYQQHQEYVVLDSAGRLQLPEEYVEALDLHRRVRVELQTDHLEIWPGGTGTENHREG